MATATIFINEKLAVPKRVAEFSHTLKRVQNQFLHTEPTVRTILLLMKIARVHIYEE
jgi:hypothetical protein